jgi:soluble lytic murein transglycosylase-like protein
VLRRSLILVLLVVAAACGPRRGSEPTMADPGLSTADRNPDGSVAERSEFACFDHPLIDAWEYRLRTERPFRVATIDSLVRGNQYLGRFREILRDAGLPPGLALLPVLESSFRVNARGPGGSVGLWQLQAPTARRFGLLVNRRHDERLDPERATQAAVAYLAMLHDRYEDWPLALAAYNAGEGRVDRALKHLPGADYWALIETHRLSPITRDYVPRFFATVRMVEASPEC